MECCLLNDPGLEDRLKTRVKSRVVHLQDPGQCGAQQKSPVFLDLSVIIIKPF